MKIQPLLLLPILALATTSAYAGDPEGVSRSFPTRLRGARPTALGVVQLGVSYRAEDTAAGTQNSLRPTVRYGIAPETRLSVSGTTRWGANAPTGFRQGSADVLHRFHNDRESGLSMALASGADFREGGLTVYQTEIDVTQRLGATRTSPHAHVNVGVMAADGRAPRILFVGGVAASAGPATTVIANYAQEPDLRRRTTIRLGEVGLRQRMDPRTTLSGGIAFGLDDTSPDWRVTLGVQRRL
jgi:hypothetical protein